MFKKEAMLLLMLLLPVFANAGDQYPWDIELPFKTAIIEYNLSGVENGSETLYIRDYGKQTAKYHKTTLNMMGMTKTSETIELVDSEWIYTFNMQEKSGKKTVNPKKYMVEEYNKLTEAEKKQVIKNSEELNIDPMFGGIAATVEKNATKILGYDCDKMSFMGSEIYTIHKAGLPLKSVSNMMGMTMLVEAKKIETNSPSSKYFNHPEGIKAVMDPDADAIARSIARETIAMLKDPKAAQKTSDNKLGMLNASQEKVSPEERQQMEQAMEALKNIFDN